MATFPISCGSASYVLGLNSCPGLPELPVSREDKDIQTMVYQNRAQPRVGP